MLGTMLADKISIHEMDDQVTFVADIQINLWQKCMQVSSCVSVEFIAQGRMPPSSCLQLLEDTEGVNGLSDAISEQIIVIQLLRMREHTNPLSQTCPQFYLDRQYSQRDQHPSRQVRDKGSDSKQILLQAKSSIGTWLSFEMKEDQIATLGCVGLAQDQKYMMTWYLYYPDMCTDQSMEHHRRIENNDD